MVKVYGLENKDGYFYNFEKNVFTMWNPNCSLPSEQLANDILLIMDDNPQFYGVVVVAVSVE